MAAARRAYEADGAVHDLLLIGWYFDVGNELYRVTYNSNDARPWSLALVSFGYRGEPSRIDMSREEIHARVLSEIGGPPLSYE